MILAIIQSIPTHPHRVIRTDTFAKFQHLCGMIEQTSYLAAHAACHATMNGFERTLVVDADMTNAESLANAAEKLFAEGPFDALVAPGLIDTTMQKAVCDVCANHVGNFAFRVFLDPERRANAEAIVKAQQALPRFATFAWPWVSTLTPGRRAAEFLPPSCLIAALALGVTDHLRGVHDLDAVSPADLDDLAENGVELMAQKTMNRRPVIGRYGKAIKKSEPKHEFMNTFVEVENPKPRTPSDDPIQDKIDRDEAAVEAMLLAQIDAKCDEVLRLRPLNNPMLWSTLTRCATSVLRDAKSRGQITDFHVRCDEETASWGTPTTPVVEVIISFAKRVKQLKLVSHRAN